MIGYPSDTQGWLFVTQDKKLVATRHAWFDKRTFIERAIAKGPNQGDKLGFVKTTGTPGIPLGGTDADIREWVRKYNDDIIECSKPDDNLTTRNVVNQYKAYDKPLSKEATRKLIAIYSKKMLPAMLTQSHTTKTSIQTPFSLTKTVTEIAKIKTATAKPRSVTF